MSALSPETQTRPETYHLLSAEHNRIERQLITKDGIMSIRTVVRLLDAARPPPGIVTDEIIPYIERDPPLVANYAATVHEFGAIDPAFAPRNDSQRSIYAAVILFLRHGKFTPQDPFLEGYYASRWGVIGRDTMYKDLSTSTHFWAALGCSEYFMHICDLLFECFQKRAKIRDCIDRECASTNLPKTVTRLIADYLTMYEYNNVVHIGSAYIALSCPMITNVAHDECHRATLTGIFHGYWTHPEEYEELVGFAAQRVDECTVGAFVGRVRSQIIAWYYTMPKSRRAILQLSRPIATDHRDVKK